jgi:lysophospholipase L1-like esterase
MKKYNNLFLVISSILISFFLIELFFFFKNFQLNKNYKFSLHNQRFMLFEEGLVFKNYGKIFKYHPNKKILSQTFYNVNDKWHKEYEYEISTNNFGLVQKNNIIKNVPSILFLGDSFIEGQGSDAWVDYFEGNYKDYQIINGGIMGTGPQQFELLEEHISKIFQIEKLIFFYIGDDLRRNIFNIEEKTLACLKNHLNCIGTENFYGFPLRKQNPISFLENLNETRINQMNNLGLYEKAKLKIKKFITNLYSIKLINNFLKQKFYTSKNEYIKRNFRSIENLIKKYDNSIIFIQLKNKNEIIHGKEYDTFFAENFIKSLNNNHFICDFDNDISNFYKLDMHPNRKGYKSLYNCVIKILNENF